MDRYMIEIEHPAERASCIRSIREILELGSHFVTHAEWGCIDDVHTGWLIIEASSHEEARLVLPPAERSRARVVRLVRFTREALDEMTKHHPD